MSPSPIKKIQATGMMRKLMAAHFQELDAAANSPASPPFQGCDCISRADSGR